MAIKKNDPTKGDYVVVERGDTLSEIAQDFAGGASKYKTLAAINDIPNPNLIYVGQKIYLTKAGTTKNESGTNAPTIKQFGLLSTPSSNSDELFATWAWSKSNTESYKVLWTYFTSKGVELQGTNTTITIDPDVPAMSRQSIYAVPAGATKVNFKVKPIAKTKDDEKKTAYWTADWSATKTYTDSTPLTTPNTPSVMVEDYTLTAYLSGIEIDGADSIVFQIVKDNSKTYATSNPIKIKTGTASYSCSVDPDGKYKVRCYAYNTSKKTKSDWSGYSGDESTIPAAPEEITSVRATSRTSIYVEWTPVSTAETYEVEYTNKKEYFDNVGSTTTKSGIETNHVEFFEIESGLEYFFRVRAVNSKGESEWTEPKSAIIGRAPAAPTTWSSTTSAIVGELVKLYWVHNSLDGSSQTYAELELTIDGETIPSITIKNTTDEDEKDKTSVYEIDTSDYEEGTSIKWRVRTAGIDLDGTDGGYGEWSAVRIVDVYAPPSLQLELTNKSGDAIGDHHGAPLTEFPVKIKALAGPPTQNPIGYSLTITSNQIYETVDSIGNPKTINAGEAVYSAYIDTTDVLNVQLDPSNIDLANGISYTITCVVSMNSGLTAEDNLIFSVAWDDITYEPNAEIGVDIDNLTATIRPYCTDHAVIYYKVDSSGNNYVKTSESVDYVYGEIIPGTRTTTGELVYSGVTVDGDEIYYCEETITSELTDVYLSVYRREYDGKFTELATGLDAAANTAVTDPHPALDYARYRIVATSKTTGTVSHYDLPGHYIGCTSIVLQWNEDWANFDVTDEDLLVQPTWSGSLLKLNYNVDVNESPSLDVSFVEYIGREHPVSYYGTQLGESATWSAVIPKSDKETIYALRRLSKWTGNVYVREPSGVGYWANIAVSFNQKHGSVTVPVSLSIRRVEGGV